MKIVVDPAPIGLSPTTLPDAVQGVSYDIQFQGSGGAGAPYTFSTTDNLPPGMGLSQTGELKGVPTSAGTYSFALQVMDGAGNAATF